MDDSILMLFICVAIFIISYVMRVHIELCVLTSGYAYSHQVMRAHINICALVLNNASLHNYLRAHARLCVLTSSYAQSYRSIQWIYRGEIYAW